jgi:hypothetical protein
MARPHAAVVAARAAACQSSTTHGGSSAPLRGCAPLIRDPSDP